MNMETKVNIILRHTRLACEYAKLANSPHDLSIQEWEQINKRMDDIVKEIHSLKTVEKTWDLTNIFNYTETA